MQRNSFQGQSSGSGGEVTAFKLLLVASLCVHIMVFWLDPSQWFLSQRPTLTPEWEIETELVGSGLPSAVALAPAVPVKEAPAEKEAPPPPPPAKEMLPQLPKKFAAKDADEPPPPAKPEEKAPPEEKPSPKKAVSEEPPKPAKPAKPAEDKPEEKEKKPEQQLAIKKDEEATQLFKKDLMERLLKEQLRQEAQQRKKEEERAKERKVLADKLASLKREAASGAAGNATIDEAHPYIVAVKGYIYENYSVPEVYNFEEAAPPIVMFTVNSAGELVQNDLYQASGNSALDQYALKSIVEAAPFFPKPPPEIIGRPIQIRFQRKA